MANELLDPPSASSIVGGLAPVPQSAVAQDTASVPTLDEVYSQHKQGQLQDMLRPEWQQPAAFAQSDYNESAYQDEKDLLGKMLKDPVNLGYTSPQIVSAAANSYNPQAMKDMAVAHRATAFLLDTPVEDLDPQKMSVYQKAVAARLGKPTPKTTTEYRNMLAEHFSGMEDMDAAIRDLTVSSVTDALADTNYGKESPVKRDMGSTVSQWMQRHPEIAADPSRHWLLARGAGDIYRNTLEDLGKVRDEAAMTLRVLADFTQGNDKPGEMDELASKVAQLPRDDRNKLFSYVGLAAEAQHIDRGAVTQLAKNLGESLSRGFDFIPQAFAQGSQGALEDMSDALAAGRVRVNASVPEGKATAKDMVLESSPDPEGFGGAAMNEDYAAARPATPEEAAAIKESLESGKRNIQAARELKHFAQQSIDPVRPLARSNSLMGAIERGMYGLAGSVPLMGTVAINPLVGVLAYQASEFDRIMVENPDMNFRAAQTLALAEGVGNSLIDEMQLRSVLGHSKMLGTVLEGMKARGVANYLKRTGIFAFEQYSQENVQDLIAPVFESITSALRQDMPDKDFGAEMKDYLASRPEVFFAVLPLALLGGGFSGAGDFKNLDAILSEDRMKMAGLSQTAREYILAATTPEEKVARHGEMWSKRTDEDIAEGKKFTTEKMNAALRERAAQSPLDYRLSVDTTRPDGVAEWVVSDPQGKEVFRSPEYDAAAEIISQHLASRLENDKIGAADLMAWAPTILNDPKSLTLAPKSVQQLFDEFNDKGDQKGIDNLVARLKFANLEGKDYNKLMVLGETTVEQVKEGVYRAVMALRENANPLDAFEEINHGFVKTALAEGTVTIEQLRDWLDQTEKATGTTIARDTELEIIENLAKITQDYAAGRIDETTLPSSFVDYLKRVVQVFKYALVKYTSLREAFDKGDIGNDFERFLAQSIGLDPQTYMDEVRDKTAAEINPDPSYSIRLAVAPVRTDKLKELTRPEMEKRSNSAKYEHLMQITSDVAEAYGVNILERAPKIGGWPENGNTSTEVPEHVTLDTDDMDLAREIAAIVGASAPQLQNGTMLWREHKEGLDYEVSFKAKNSKAAADIAAGFEAAGVQGFTYDPKTRMFSLVMPSMTEETKKELQSYVKEYTTRGSIPISSSLEARPGTAAFPSESDYRRLIQGARNRADLLGGEQGDKINSVAARAERRIKKYEAGKKTRAKARKLLAKMTAPFTSTTKVLEDLDGRQFENIREFAKYLDERFTQKHGFGIYEIGSEAGRVSAADSLVHDILTGLANDGSGQGWYDERVRETLLELKKIHPEFDNDPDSQAVYIGILASTSQGYTVTENFKQAERVFAEWKKTGKIPSNFDFAKSSDPINQNLRFMQDFIDQHGLHKFRKFMDSEVTGRQLRDKHSLEAEGVTLEDTARGSAVLGPKIGSFFNNLRGRFDTITMDLWYTRSMHRYLGETTEPMDSERMQELLVRFREKLKDTKRNYAFSEEDTKSVALAMTDDDEAVKVATRIMARWARGENAYTENTFEKFADGYEIEKASRDITTNSGMKGAPKNKTYRNYFADIVMEAKGKLESMGIKLSEADMQAIVWYAEKNLFAKVGVANESAKPADYLDAAMQTRKRYADGYDHELAKYDGWKSVEVTKQGRAFSPIVRDLLQRRANGENISRETIDRAINQHFPSQLAPVPAGETDLPTQDEVNNAVGKKATEAVQKETIKAGQPVTIRQDVPSWTNHGVGVVTVDTEDGKAYAPSASIDNPQFVIDRKTEALALRIAMGGDKKPHIQIKGTWSEDQSMPTDLEQRTQVGYNPDRHSFYYDRANGKQIEGASHAYQIGNVVFVTDPKYGDGKISDLSYSIRDQAEIDQIETALGALNRGPEGRLAVYRMAKQKFLDVLRENRDIIDAIKATKIDVKAQLSPEVEKLDTELRDTLADLEVEELGATEEALNENEDRKQAKLEGATSREQITEINRSARERASVIKGGISSKYIEKRKALRGDIAARKTALKTEANQQDVASNALLREKVQSAQFRQAVAELDGLLKALPTEVMGRVGGFSRLANMPTTDAGLGKFFLHRIDMVEREIERYLKKSYDEELDAILERSKPKKFAPGEKPKGIGAEIQRVFAAVREAVAYTPKELEAKLASLDAMLADPDITPEREAELQQISALITLAGDWKPRYEKSLNPKTGKEGYRMVSPGADSGRRASAVEALKATWAKGYAEFKRKKEAQRQQRDAARAEAVASTGKNGGYAERLKRSRKENGVKGFARKLYLSLLSWDQLLGTVFGNETYVATKYSDEQRRAENAKDDAVYEKMDEIDTLLTKLSGGTRLDGERLRYNLATEQFKVGDLELTQLEAITATMMWEQEDGRRHMLGIRNNEGDLVSDWSYDQDFIDKIEFKLSPYARAIRQFLWAKYEAEYNEINAVYKEINGIDLPKVQMYSPILVKPVQAPSGMVNDAVTGMAVSAASISPGALRTRSSTAVAEPEFRDALATYMAHTQQMEHWKAFAPMTIELNAILRNRNVQNAIEEAASKEATTVLNLHLDMFAQGGNRDAAGTLGVSKDFGRVTGRAAQVALVGRIGTLLIQATQLGAAVAEMPVGAYALRLSKLLSGQLGWGDALSSDYIQRRIREMPPIVRQGLEGLKSGKPNYLKHQVARLGQLISGTDGLFTAGTYAIVLDYHRQQAERMGMNAERADAYAHNVAQRATDRLAQPTRAGTRSIYERTSNGVAGKLLWAFSSEPRKNLALAAYSVANRPADVAARTIGGLLILNTLAGAIIRNAWKDAKDDDDDEIFDSKHWNPSRFAMALLTEPLQGLPVVGAAAQEGAYAASGNYYNPSNLLSTTRAIQAVFHIDETLAGDRDADQMMGDLDAILSTLGLANENIAAVASLSHLAKDLFGLTENTAKTITSPPE